MKVLAVGAHPDDIELGAGGTIARHVLEGDDVYFLILTYGEQSGEKEERKKEAIESAKVLKVNSVYFCGIPDTKVTDGIETIMAIENLINEIKPQRVYTQCHKDRHQDHRNTALATYSAARRVPEILAYESPDSYPNFSPQYYVQIADTIKQKILALKKYRSQQNKRYFEVNAIKGLAQFRGYQIGVPYAEAFEVIRVVKI
ncbi:MAG: PIG-L deacetylase family protein [Nitrososphaeria archaeon]